MPGEHKAALNPTLDCATSLRPMLGCGAGLRPAQGCGTVLHPAQGSGTGCPMLGCDTGLHPTPGSGTVSRSAARSSRCSTPSGLEVLSSVSRVSPFAHDRFAGVRRTMTFRSVHGLWFRAFSLLHVCGMEFRTLPFRCVRSHTVSRFQSSISEHVFVSRYCARLRMPA